MPYKDRDKQREYQRKWILSRRDEYLSDKSCKKCGSKKNLEVDHIDPKKKLSHRIWSWSKKRREAELKKCQVLCKDCHKSKSAKAEHDLNPKERRVVTVATLIGKYSTREQQDVLQIIGDLYGDDSSMYNLFKELAD